MRRYEEGRGKGARKRGGLQDARRAALPQAGDGQHDHDVQALQHGGRPRVCVRDGRGVEDGVEQQAEHPEDSQPHQGGPIAEHGPELGAPPRQHHGQEERAGSQQANGREQQGVDGRGGEEGLDARPRDAPRDGPGKRAGHTVSEPPVAPSRHVIPPLRPGRPASAAHGAGGARPSLCAPMVALPPQEDGVHPARHASTIRAYTTSPCKMYANAAEQGAPTHDR